MSLLYGTDEKIIRSEEILSNSKHPSQMRWHRLLDICREKGVSDSHFRTYMTGKNSTFDDAEVMLFDCMKKGIVKFTTKDAILKRNQRIYGEDGEELENDPDDLELGPEEKTVNKKYEYSIDTENPACKKLFRKYIKEQLLKNNDAEIGFETLMSNIKGDLLKHGKIEGLEGYFEQLQNESLNEFIKEYQKSSHNAYQKSDKFDYDIEVANRNNIDSVKQTQKLNDTLAGVDKFSNFNRVNKNDIGNVLLDELQNEVILHRGHSVFFMLFHPIKYYREGKSISEAKTALVNLGADKAKVDEFVENTMLEDKYLRDKKDIVKARAVNGVLLNLKFEDLGKDADISDEDVDDLIMDDEEKVEEPFTERLAGDIVKSENTAARVPVDNVPVDSVPVNEQESVKESEIPVQNK